MQPAILLEALAFAAERHRDQRRKGADASPYINHPIEVARVLAGEGGVTDETLLVGAVLHDTVEDTRTTSREIEQRFGSRVAALVVEVTDDKSRPKSERKRLQIAHAREASPEARQLKLADKTCNVRDITASPPADWPLARRLEYLDWSEQVVAGCRGANPRLEEAFDEAVAAARAALSRA